MSSVPPPPSTPPEGPRPPYGRTGPGPQGQYPPGQYPPGRGPYLSQQGGYQPGYGYDQQGGPGRPGLQGWGAPQQDRTMAVVTHVIPLVAMFISVGWLGFVGPLVIWFIYRQGSPFVRRTAAGAFNFTVTIWLANLVAWICFATIILIPVAILLWIAAFVLAIIFHISGAIRANRGQLYVYPLQIPILR
ncbi:DUF4870 domain-containing protein [Tersicoccus sp. MR15.9]|uniref:DUF4870 domain-containing protein n=1 Tax=Tersicoccus mangrovi TaxID=3121635 RepID=UPI002FE5463E